MKSEEMYTCIHERERAKRTPHHHFNHKFTMTSKRDRLSSLVYLGCWAVPLTPASPTTPIANPAARPERPTASPAPRCKKPDKRDKTNRTVLHRMRPANKDTRRSRFPKLSFIITPQLYKIFSRLFETEWLTVVWGV